MKCPRCRQFRGIPVAIITLLSLLCSFAVTVSAETTAAPTVNNPALTKIAGVYKKRFKNDLVDGSSYMSENILEIVPVEEDAFYFKTHLEFFNGHRCSLFGVAKQSTSGFVYQDPAAGSETLVCSLTFSVDNDAVTFSDPNGACQSQNCGARGSFNGVKFPFLEKRKIGYLDLLLRSKDYVDSLASYRKGTANPNKD